MAMIIKSYHLVVRALVIIVSTLMLLTACTTAMYTKPTLLNKSLNTYNFTIETSLFSGADTSDKRAVQEIQRFMIAKRYTSFKIIHRTEEFIPSAFKYKVRFSK